MAPATYLVMPCKIAVEGKSIHFILSKIPPKKGIWIVIMYSFQTLCCFPELQTGKGEEDTPLF